MYLVSSSTLAINVSTSVILFAKFVLSTLVIGVSLIFGSTTICPGQFANCSLTVSFLTYAIAVVGTLVKTEAAGVPDNLSA